MPKHASVLLLALLLVTACKMNGAVIEESAHSSAAASAETSADSSSSVMEEASAGPWAAVKTWAPTLVWSNIIAGTNDGALTIDAEHVIPAGAMQTKVAMTPITAQQYLMIFQDGPSHDALEALLAKDGWALHDSIAADGATGTQWGYSKTDASGVQFLIISANGTDCTGAPAVCTTYMAKISITDALAAGDDL